MKQSIWYRMVSALILLVALALLGTLAAIVVWGRHYYALPFSLRDAHALHAYLASGSGGGVLLGIIGTTLMSGMLLYTLRKKLAKVRALGPLSLWLQFHVMCGVVGPLFIVVHTGLRLPQGLIAVGFWCMILVAVSGAFGRYVYGFLPRMSSGRALAWDEAMDNLADLRAELVDATATDDGEAIGEAVAMVRDFDVEASTLGDLFTLDKEVRRTKRMISNLLRHADLEPSAHAQATAVLGDQLKLKRALEASRVAFRLFRYWHLFHRPLAGAMYVIVFLHVAFAIVFGGSLQHVAQFFAGGGA